MSGKPGFFANIGLPFGMSNANTQQQQPAAATTAQPAQPAFQSGAQQLAQPQNNPLNVQPANGGAGLPAADPANSADPTKGVQGSQLDSFQTIFTMPTGADGKVIEQPNPHAEPLLNIDPAKLGEVASKMNFAAGINPELLQKAQTGDAQAMTEVLSAAGRNAFVAATSSMARVVEDAISRNNARSDSTLANRVRDVQINQAPVKHPALAHPAAKPMVDALKIQIATTNPHLSPEKVAEHAENYVIALSTDVNNVNQQQVQSKTKSTEPDFSSFLV